MTVAPQTDPAAVFESLPAIVARRVQERADGWSLTFLEGEGEPSRIDLDHFAARVLALAQLLEQVTQPGELVLLLYPPGIDFLVGFMACLTANRAAVPINPPRRNRLIERVDGIIADTKARTALTTSAMLRDQAWWRGDDTPLARLTWHETDRVDNAVPPHGWNPQIDAQDIAFLQYTSGSTSAPKGVAVSHGNLIAEMQRMAGAWDIGPRSVMVTWLPAFHDLGLIFGLLQPLFSGCATIAMAPAGFMQAPYRWLEAISRYRGTHTAAPSFAYDLCLRRITQAQQSGLDLSSLRMAMNAAEPIDPTVMAAFATRVGPSGFQSGVSCPAYGLAEATLALTANPIEAPPLLLYVDARALSSRGQAVPVAATDRNGRALVGCGRPLPQVGIRIVDPDSHRALEPGVVGEVWASGPTIATGYWKNPIATAETFGGRIAGEGSATYLRTGDLGFMYDGELVITGRIKDVIIIRGVNYYPQDLERAAFRSHQALRAECGAAFSLPPGPGNTEQIVIVQEVERVHRKMESKVLLDAIREAIWDRFDVTPETIVLVEPGSVLRTSSGKIRRGATRDAWLEGRLPVIASWRQAAAGVAPGQPGDAVGLRAWLLGWLAQRLGVSLTGIDPDESFATYGLDSLAATELAVALGQYLATPITPSLAWDHPTPNRLLAHVSGVTNPSTATTRAPSANAAPGKDVEELLKMIEQA